MQGVNDGIWLNIQIEHDNDIDSQGFHRQLHWPDAQIQLDPLECVGLDLADPDCIFSIALTDRHCQQ